MKTAIEEYNELIEALIQRTGFLGLVTGGHIPFKENPCQGCPLYKHGQTVPAAPSSSAKIMFITTHNLPARSEEALLFAKITEATLSRAVLLPKDICTTSFIRCAPSGISRLDMEAMRRCSRLLFSEVKRRTPGIIVIFDDHEEKTFKERFAKTNATIVTVSSLSTLLNDPEKRKQCWEGIKQVLKAD